MLGRSGGDEMTVAVFAGLALGLVACDPGSGSTDDQPADQGTSGSDLGGEAEAVTWHSAIAPLLADRCGACHRDGGIAPFSVETYAQAAPWAPAMLAEVEAGRMPPFYAADTEDCAMDVGFMDDVRLDEAERSMLATWVDAGAPEGDPEGAEPVVPRQVDRLEGANALLTLPEPFAVSGTEDVYQCFRIPLEHVEDIWITGLEVVPDNELVVHHVLVWHDPEDQSADRVGADGSYRCSGVPDVWPSELVAAWTPGGSPMQTPPNTGTLVHPGASLVVNVHYHPTGTTTEIDQSSVALRWTTEQPEQHATWFLVDVPFGARTLDPPFLIPAGAARHEETVQLTVPEFVPFDLPVFAITPHMHYLGTEMLVTRESADDSEESCLIHTPGFRFDFQASYVYDPSTGELPVIRPGDRVSVRCTYDNSEQNPYLDLQLDAAGWESPGNVAWGEETGDEMCMAMVGLIIPPIDWLVLAEALF